VQRGSPCWCPEGTKATSMHHPMRWQCLCPLWPSQCRCRGCCGSGSEVVASCREAVPVGVQRAQRRRQRIIRCTGSAFATSGHPTVIVLGVAVVDPRWQHHAERQSPLASSKCKGDANASSDALAVGGCGGLDGSNSGSSSSVVLLHSAQHEHFVDSEGESMGVLMMEGLGTHNQRWPSDWKWAASREVAQSVGKSVLQSSIVQSVVQRVAKARETKCARSWINLKCRPV
jgi:hypothetical protein